MEAFSCFLLDCIGALLSFNDNSFAAKGFMTQPVHVIPVTLLAGKMLLGACCLLRSVSTASLLVVYLTIMMFLQAMVGDIS